jgi:polar amino acid transport system permease protein
MQGDTAVTVESAAPLAWSGWSLVDGFFSAIWSVLQPILAVIDPLCGPVGVFSLIGGSGELSCGDVGWGDEIAFGFYVTASLALSTLPLGLLAGFFLALAKQSEERYLRAAADIYTTLFRGLPELLTLFIIFFGLPFALENLAGQLGFSGPIEINTFVAGMIAIGIVFSSYCSEVLQSAFKAIPQGQYEGGYAVGLTRYQTMRHIIVPQLVRIALPGLGNLWMILIKDTALVSAIGLPDILRQSFVAAKVTKHAFTFTGIACLLFLVLAMLSSVIFARIEARARRAEVRT